MEDNRLKQRLVGAIVLVSLAVIFIPMLLSGGDPATRHLTDTNIPKKPDNEFVSRIIPLDKQAPEPAQLNPDETKLVQPVKVYKRPEPNKTEVKTTEAPKKTVKAETKTTEKPKTTVAKVEPKPQKTLQKKTTVSQLKEGWVVQVGSFSSKKNAYALSDKLREKGFGSFVDSISKSGKTTYRVRIGPEAKKAKATDLLAKAQKLTGTKGFVVRYP